MNLDTESGAEPPDTLVASRSRLWPWQRREASGKRRSTAALGPWALSSSTRNRPIPRDLTLVCRRLGIRLSRHLLLVRVQSQRLVWLEITPAAQAIPSRSAGPAAMVRQRGCYPISTSRCGIGQVKDTNRTPLGLHRIAHKAGGGWPVGVVLVNREPSGFTWQGCPDAAIAHRVLWLEGLESGWNRGGNVDTFERYIYLHGVGNELTLGRPASRGCIHLAAGDLMPLYDRLPVGTLVWISRR